MIPPTLLPSAGGPNLAREVSTLLSLLDAPDRPFVAITGGAKVKDKLGIMKVLSAKADVVIVGGGMAYTFAAAEDRSIGARSLTPTTSSSAVNSSTEATCLSRSTLGDFGRRRTLVLKVVPTRWSTSARTFPTTSWVSTSVLRPSRSSKRPSRARERSLERTDGCV